MAKDVDLLDLELIKLLGMDASQSNQVIAGKLKVTPATVRRRKRQLMKKGALRIVGAVNPVKIGFAVSVIVAFDVEGSKLESTVKLLAARPEITWVSTTTGRFDIMAMARLHSTEELSDFVSKTVTSIDGLRDSETFVCLHTAKGDYSVMFTGAQS